MKANELMVGDFVKVNRDVCIKNGTIVEIRAIDADNAFIEKGLKGCATCVNINDHCEFGGVWVDFLEPIPLTQEILEKNGFEYNLDRGVYMLGIIFQVKPERNGMFSISICGCPQLINTIHKLQHALRLCGIEKTIEL